MEKLYSGFSMEVITFIVRDLVSVNNSTNRYEHLKSLEGVIRSNLDLVSLINNITPDFIYDSDEEYPILIRIFLYVGLKMMSYIYGELDDNFKFTEAHKSFIKLSDLENAESKYQKYISNMNFFRTLDFIINDDDLVNLILEEDSYVMYNMKNENIIDMLIYYIEHPKIIFDNNMFMTGTEISDYYDRSIIDNNKYDILRHILIYSNPDKIIKFIEMGIEYLARVGEVEENIILHLFEILSEIPFDNSYIYGVQVEEEFNNIHNILKNRLKEIMESHLYYRYNENDIEGFIKKCDNINLPGYMKIYTHMIRANTSSEKIVNMIDEYIK